MQAVLFSTSFHFRHSIITARPKLKAERKIVMTAWASIQNSGGNNPALCGSAHQASPFKMPFQTGYSCFP